MLKQKTFKGGIHPGCHKELTRDKAIENAPVPQKLVIPLQQGVGNKAKSLVKSGDIVRMGQLIGDADGFISAKAHSPVSGKVLSVSKQLNPVYGKCDSVVVENDGQDTPFADYAPVTGVSGMSAAEMLEAVKDAGIVGLGGAAFPTHVKLSPPKNKTVDTVILNAAECEPYLNCDNRLMIENAGEVIKWLEVIARILGVKNVYIGIEDNKPGALKSLEKGLGADSGAGVQISVEVLPAKYPQGAEKQIINAITGRIVPAGGLPMDVGCVVQNAGTAFAVYEAVYMGKPLMERVVTITGSCVKKPGNYRVRIGTVLSDLKDTFGGFSEDPKKFVSGGPMMGIAQYSMDIPVTKSTSGALFLTEKEAVSYKEGVCIRCGKCIEACPMQLVPTALMLRVKKAKYGEAKEMGIANCYECGSCAFVCPARIPLLDYMKYGKAMMPK